METVRDARKGGQRRPPVWQITHLTLARLSWHNCRRALVAAGMLSRALEGQPIQTPLPASPPPPSCCWSVLTCLLPEAGTVLRPWGNLSWGQGSWPGRRHLEAAERFIQQQQQIFTEKQRGLRSTASVPPPWLTDARLGTAHPPSSGDGPKALRPALLEPPPACCPREPCVSASRPQAQSEARSSPGLKQVSPFRGGTALRRSEGEGQRGGRAGRGGGVLPGPAQLC